MIQRIQTLYLLGIAVLLAFFFFTPFATYTIDPQMDKFQFLAFGLTAVKTNPEMIYRTTPLIIISIIAMAIPLVSIFLYKHRMIQIRLCIVNTILLLGMQGLLYYYVNAVSKLLPAPTQYGIIFIFPLVSAILSFLALRAIAKDEALIRSLERLR